MLCYNFNSITAYFHFFISFNFKVSQAHGTTGFYYGMPPSNGYIRVSQNHPYGTLPRPPPAHDYVNDYVGLFLSIICYHLLFIRLFITIVVRRTCDTCWKSKIYGISAPKPSAIKLGNDEHACCYPSSNGRGFSYVTTSWRHTCRWQNAIVGGQKKPNP